MLNTLVDKYYFFSNNGQLISKMMMEETTTTTTRTVCPTASSATRELDDLMASLSDFKVRICVKTKFILYFYGLNFVHKIITCCLY